MVTPRGLTTGAFGELAQRNAFAVVFDICRGLAAAGARPYFVGGCVRDALLGLPVFDFDVEVFGMSIAAIEEFLSRTFTIEKTGKSFCVLKIRGFPIDISVPRMEIKSGAKHTDFSVIPLEDCALKTAASRRDFTINSIYFDPLCEELVDEFGGVDDLNSKILRHVSEKFSEDPLRVLRGMQFAGRFNLSAAPETVALCRTLSMVDISRERIFSEWEKLLLQSTAPSFGLRFLKNSGWIKFFPEIDALDACMQDSDRHPEGSVFEHTCLALDAFAGTKIGDQLEDEIIGFAALCHDFGKPSVTTQDERGIHHYGHDGVGLQPTESFLRAINAPKYLIDAVLPLVRWHMTPFVLYESGKTDASVLRLANGVGRIDRLLRLCHIDFVGRTKVVEKYDEKVDMWLRETAKRFGVLASRPAPIVHGRDLIALGMRPSEKFSEILDKCFDAQLDCKFFDHASGVEYLKSVLLQ
ncbi:MAG: HD domain-containing protein [Puniceicoccales bacterium]|jgi:tRNA nucleotidyltransferase (CCA-adding enzyme)|nr:HD domain-containing protein [Puniceicoccales bacterium]